MKYVHSVWSTWIEQDMVNRNDVMDTNVVWLTTRCRGT